MGDMGVFLHLSMQPDTLSEATLTVLERFVILMSNQIKIVYSNKNTKISTYTVIIKLNNSKTPFIILAQIII